MRHREVIVGVAVLALVVAGVWWARPPSPAAGHFPPASARQAASVSPMASARQAPSPETDDALTDVTLADGSADAGEGVRITVSVTPNPPVAMAKTRVRVRVVSNGSPVAIENGRISFEMAMPMGDHRYTLLPGEEGWLEAAVVLPT